MSKVKKILKARRNLKGESDRLILISIPRDASLVQMKWQIRRHFSVSLLTALLALRISCWTACDMFRIVDGGRKLINYSCRHVVGGHMPKIPRNRLKGNKRPCDDVSGGENREFKLLEIVFLSLSNARAIDDVLPQIMTSAERRHLDLFAQSLTEFIAYFA